MGKTVRWYSWCSGLGVANTCALGAFVSGPLIESLTRRANAPPFPLFSALILRTLLAGTHVIMDRYAFSGVAFSAAKPGLDADWCAAPDAGLPAPDVVLFMDLTPAAQAARGGFGGERYEVPAFQVKVRAAFAVLRDRVVQHSTVSWHDVDASGSIEEVEVRVEGLIQPAITIAVAATLKALWEGDALIK